MIPPTVAVAVPSSSYSKAPSVKMTHGFSLGRATNLRGSPEVTRLRNNFKAETWLSPNATWELFVDPSCLKSCVASLPDLPATCMSANCSLPRWEGSSFGLTFFSRMILSSIAFISSILSCLLRTLTTPSVLADMSSSTPSISFLASGSRSFSSE